MNRSISTHTGLSPFARTAGIAAIAFTALATLTPFISHEGADASTASTVIARIAAGGAVTDRTGAHWASDAKVATGGKSHRFKANVLGTTNDPAYLGERYGSFTYNIKVPSAGTYHVQLNETETTFTHPKQRVFSVKAEGITKESGIDIVKMSGGRFRALSLSFNVHVKDGKLTLQFISKTNYARISSVLVTKPATTSGARASTPAAASTSSAPTPPKPAATSSSIYGSPFVGDPTAPLGGFFGSNSVFKVSLAGAPVDPNSPALVSTLVSQVQEYYGGNAGFNVWSYNASNYTVGASQAKVDLKWDNCQNKTYVPSSLFGPDGFMVQVPLPSDAVPSVGSDAAIGIYQPSSDTYWGFWKLNKQADGWHACWGGKISQVSQSRGWYDNGGGVSATGLADGGTVDILEAQAGHIDHAIALGILSPADWHRFDWPALRSDGNDISANAIPEGTRFRLDPTLNVDALNLSPLGKMVAKAAQTYGFIVNDKSGVVGIATESGAAVANVTGVNPWNAMLGSTPSYMVMHNFPWDKLQAMPAGYGQS